ncbi:hypothetical protein HDV05_008051, partial [Chytridiales sp. JEL 0842]
MQSVTLLQFNQNKAEKVLLLDCTSEDVMVHVPLKDLKNQLGSYLQFLDGDGDQLESVEELCRSLADSPALDDGVVVLEEFERRWGFQLPWKELIVKLSEVLSSLELPYKSVKMAVDIAKCPKLRKFTLDASSCDSAKVYQLLRRASELAVRHCYRDVDIVTLQNANTANLHQKQYKKVLINFMMDRFWYCPKVAKLSDRTNRTDDPTDECPDDAEVYDD